MFKRLVLFILSCLILATWQTSSRAQMGTPASARKDRAPYQVTFGPLTAVAPFNEANNYTVIPTESQLFPQTLWTNNFSSTGSFTNSSSSTPATFTVSGNVGSLTATGASNNFLQDTQTSFTSPLAFVSLDVNQNAGSGIAGIQIGVGLCKDSNNGIFYIKRSDTLSFVRARVAGVNTDTTISNGLTIPTATWKIGFALSGASITGWVNAGSGWQTMGGANISSAFDPRPDGNLTGYNACIIQNTDRAGTWEISNLRTGYPGGSGLRDLSLVRHDDGRPLYNGTKVYFTATTNLGTGGYDGVWSYDFSSSTWAWVGAILDDISSVQYTDVASQLLYNDVTGVYRYLVGGWGHESGLSIHTFYTSFNKASIDPLAGGVKVVTGAVQLNLPFVATNFYGWDAHMACTAFNYLTGACGNWLLGYAVGSGGSGYHPGLVSTTSDPSVNSWTSIAQDTGYTSTEGARIIRVNGAEGVTYYPAFGGSSNSSVKYQPVYDASLNRIAFVNATLPASGLNAPHPEIFSYGNNTYLFTFNNNLISGGGNNSAGNVLMASAPRYAAGNSTFQLANNFNTGTAASISTATFPVDKGSTVVVFCRGPGTSGLTLSASSAPSATWNTVASVPGVTGTTAVELMAYTVAPSDQMSVTCTPSASASNMGIIAVEIPAVTTVDAGATWSGTFATATSATSGAWSTAEPATGLFCITTFTNNTQFFQAGNIAGAVSNLSANDDARSVCESSIMGSPQTSQTAAVSWTGSSVQSTAIFGAFH